MNGRGLSWLSLLVMLAGVTVLVPGVAASAAAAFCRVGPTAGGAARAETRLATLHEARSAALPNSQPGALPGRIAVVRYGLLWFREGEREEPLTRLGRAHSPRFSADGRYLAFYQEAALWVVGPDQKPAKAADAVRTAAWAPDAPVMAVATPDGIATIRVTDAGPQAPRLIARGWAEPAWSPDGRTLAVVRNEAGPAPGGPGVFEGKATIGLLSPEGGEPKILWQGPYRKDLWVGSVTHLKWSADGQWLAFYRCALSASAGADINELNVLSLKGGEPVPLTSGPANPDYFAWARQGAALAFTAGAGRVAWENKRLQLAALPPQPPLPPAPFASPTPAGHADREPAWSPDGRFLYFIRSAAKMPERMDMPGPEQAIYRWEPAKGETAMVPGTEDSLGLAVGRRGELLWFLRDGKDAKLMALRNDVPVEVTRLDMPCFYYGQFGWNALFGWSERSE